jgi:steroid 5-alpha reductase family enzyme
VSRDVVIFVLGAFAATALLLTAVPGSAQGLVVAILALTALWIVSLPLRNASIVDIFWGTGFIVMGLYYFLVSPNSSHFRGLLVLSMTVIWGLRLTLHLAIRNTGAGEDFRYAAWREESGPSFWWKSFFKVFLLQAVVLWIVSSPLLLAWHDSGRPGLTLLDVIGIGLWVFGFVFESVADLQLTLFKRDPANTGKIMSSGLWSLSRHPNYFGEAVLWWGIGLVAVSAGGWLAVIGPALITFSLIRVSGVTMLDSGLIERRPGYAEYMRTTPAFLPRLRALKKPSPHDANRD